MKKILLPLLITISHNLPAQNGFTYFAAPPGYLSSLIRDKNAIEPDNAGNLWVAFERIGLGKLHIASQTWSMYDTSNSPLTTGVIRSLAIDAAGNIWAGTIRGLYKYDNVSWTSYLPSNSAIPDTVILSLMRSGNDMLIGTNKGFSIMSGTNFTSYSTANSSIVSDTITCIEMGSSGNIYLGTTSGLSRFNAGSFTNFTVAVSGLQNNSIRFLKYSTTGSLWISTTSGLCRLTGNTVHSVPPCNFDYTVNFMNTNLGSIEKDNAGNVITFYPDFLARIHDNFKVEVLDVSVSNNFPFHRFKYDASGKLWFGIFSSLASSFGYFDSLSSVGFAPYMPGSTFLDINEVAALVHNKGDMFGDMATGKQWYRVPKCSGKNSAWVTGLVLGGIDNNGLLKASSMTYRQTGEDYWGGPLDTTNASFDSIAAMPYDRMWKVNRYTVEDFKYHFLNGTVTNGTWPVPEEILTWPAIGSGNLAHNLAPYVDFNTDGNYNPYDGDYPLIKGDQMLFSIFNDVAHPKTETNSAAFGFEIHASAYAFTCPNLPDSEQVLNYTTLYHYKIINRSAYSYHDMYSGIFADMDLGYYFDDYSGCDTVLNACFIYNGDNYDDPPDGYGFNPPMINHLILKGPTPVPNDSIDNDHDGTTDEAGENNMLSSFVSYIKSSGTPWGTPHFTNDIYNYLRAIWRDTSHVTYGGIGWNPGSTNNIQYTYPGAPYDTSAWNETTAGNSPSEKRFFASSGPFAFGPGESREFEFAVVFTWDSINPNGPNTSLAKNTHDLQKVIYWFDNNNFPSCLPLNVNVADLLPGNDFEIFPNPASNEITLAGKFNAGDQLEITDIMGRQILVKQIASASEKISIALPAISRGIYFIGLHSKHSAKFKKLVKK